MLKGQMKTAQISPSFEAGEAGSWSSRVELRDIGGIHFAAPCSVSVATMGYVVLCCQGGTDMAVHNTAFNAELLEEKRRDESE